MSQKVTDDLPGLIEVVWSDIHYDVAERAD